MTRWITYAACALVFVLLLAPARRSAEPSSNKSYPFDDEHQIINFPFSGQGEKANDIHIKWKQKVHVRGARAYNPGDRPPGEEGETQEKGNTWNVEPEKDAQHGNDTTEMTLSKLRGVPDLPAGGNLRLEIDPLEDKSKQGLGELVAGWQWTLDRHPIGEEIKLSSTRGDGGVGAAQVATANGLRTVTFGTLPGRVIVNLPDDMRAGDTISGTVVAEPKGQTPEERKKNMSLLGDRKINIATAKKPDGTSDVNVEVPVAATPSPFTCTLPPRSTPTPPLTNVSSANSGGLGITLTNTSGSLSTGGTTTIPIEMVSLSLQTVAPLKLPQLPTIGQQGRPIEIYGPFDGNSSNTKLMYGPAGSSIQDFEKNTENVTGGFGLLQPLAESPRKCVFESPTNVTGPVEIKLKEGNQETKGTYRNVGVNLTAPKTSLLKGESTELHVEVNGLQGIKEPVPLTLESHGVITMEGGTYQPLMIQPSQVGADGRYSTTRGITGVQTGVWGATATVVTHRFDVCLQDDSSPQTVILWNSFTGDYLFTPSGGTSLSGQGAVTRNGCTITLTDSPPDRKVQGNIDPCTKTGSASVQLVSPKVKFTITDRNTADNTCTCGPGCK